MARLVPFAAGVGAIIAVAVVILPGATVTIYPVVSTEAASLHVIADPRATAVSLTGLIPARTIRAEVSVDGEIQVAERVLVPTSSAKGEVQFVNLTDSPVELPQGTIVFGLPTAPIRFATLRPALLPAAPGKPVEVPIEAVLPGIAGNVEANQIQSLEGAAGYLVQVANLTATTGGAQAMVVGPSESDRAALREQVVTQAKVTAADRFAELAGADGLLLEESIELSSVLEEVFDPAGPGRSQTLSLRMRLVWTAVSVSRRDAEILASSALAPIPSGSAVEGPPDVSMGGASLRPDGTYGLDLDFARHLRPVIAASSVREVLRGNKSARALDLLRLAGPQRAAPGIRMQPSWWPWMPFAAIRISVDVR
jgi:hypothetical protein